MTVDYVWTTYNSKKSYDIEQANKQPSAYVSLLKTNYINCKSLIIDTIMRPLPLFNKFELKGHCKFVIMTLYKYRICIESWYLKYVIRTYTYERTNHGNTYYAERIEGLVLLTFVLAKLTYHDESQRNNHCKITIDVQCTTQHYHRCHKMPLHRNSFQLTLRVHFTYTS